MDDSTCMVRALERLSYFKAPGYVAFVDELPVTSTNKVQKARLADFASNPLAGKDCFDLREGKIKPRDLDGAALLGPYLKEISRVIDAVDGLEK